MGRKKTPLGNVHPRRRAAMRKAISRAVRREVAAREVAARRNQRAQDALRAMQDEP